MAFIQMLAIWFDLMLTETAAISTRLCDRGRDRLLTAAFECGV